MANTDKARRAGKRSVASSALYLGYLITLVLSALLPTSTAWFALLAIVGGPVMALVWWLDREEF